MSTFLGWDASLVQGYVPVYVQAGWKETLWEPSFLCKNKYNAPSPGSKQDHSTPFRHAPSFLPNMHVFDFAWKGAKFNQLQTMEFFEHFVKLFIASTRILKAMEIHQLFTCVRVQTWLPL